MIEIHAWITLRHDDYDCNDQDQEVFIERFKIYLEKNHSGLLSSNYVSLHSYNGLDCFAIHTLHNHRGVGFYPLEIFQWVAEEGKGSYGMLYCHDDEDKEDANNFLVYCLKRGKVIKQEDKFLSPYFPEVEREYDSNDPPKD